MKQVYALSSCKKRLPLFSMIISLVCSLNMANAQQPDHKGTDFWLGFPGNFQSDNLYFYINAEEATTGAVYGAGFTQEFSVTPGKTTTITLPSESFEMNKSDQVEDKGIHIVSKKEISVYGLNKQSYTTDGYLALPTDVLGTSYINLAYQNTNVVNSTQFGIVASEDGTTVTITPSRNTGTHAAGLPYLVSLNQGQTYLLRNEEAAPADLSGSIISSNKPIAVFGGMQCANIPANYIACDYLIEQLSPITTWGKTFLSVPLQDRQNGDTYRFLASANNTSIEINGAVAVVLNKGQYYETMLTNAALIKANNPISVAQYANSTSFDNMLGDPFMLVLTPVEQYLGSYHFSTPTSGFESNVVNITVPEKGVGKVTLDGEVIPDDEFFLIPSSGFYGVQVNISKGAHVLDGAGFPVGISVYGFNKSDSYGYSGGQALSPVALADQIKLSTSTPDGKENVNEASCVEASVADAFGNPLSGIRVDFNIAGSNEGNRGFAFTGKDGVARYCYAGTRPGEDKIVALTGGLNASALLTWVTMDRNTFYSKSEGDLSDLSTWGTKSDGSGTSPTDFGEEKTFNLANREGSYVMNNDWEVAGTLSVPTGSRLNLNGSTLTLSSLSGGGSLEGTSSASLVIKGKQEGDFGTINFTEGSVLKSLTINTVSPESSVTLGTPLAISDELSVENGKLLTNNNLTLKSTDEVTARVSPVSGSIIGNVTVERFIPARRSWRIVSSPVGGDQTINAAWQEGVTTDSPNANPNPGYGTHITGGSTNDGFDQNITGASAPSIKWFDSPTNSWLGVANTQSTTVGNKPFMLFVRGDRGIALGGSDVKPTNTTLRANGPLLVGDQTIQVNGTGFTAIANPFASAINFASITRTNVKNSYYIWEPRMGGSYGLGAYLNISFNGTGYDIVPALVSPDNQYIQSGQGFLVESTGDAGSVVIKESDKTDGIQQSAARKTDEGAGTPFFASAKNAQGLRINLQTISDDGTNTLDGILATYGSAFSNNIDEMDVIKLPNLSESLSLLRQGQQLMVERRSSLGEKGDTLYLNLYNTKQRNYLLEFIPNDLTDVVSATLVDGYLHLSTSISTTENTRINFQINGDAASSGIDRFKVILITKKPTETMVNNGKPAIKIYPNPVSSGITNLSFENMESGTYNLQLINSAGQIVLRKDIRHPGGSLTQKLDLGNRFPAGIYQLKVTGKNTKTIIKVLNK